MCQSRSLILITLITLTYSKSQNGSYIILNKAQIVFYLKLKWIFVFYFLKCINEFNYIYLQAQEVGISLYLKDKHFHTATFNQYQSWLLTMKWYANLFPVCSTLYSFSADWCEPKLDLSHNWLSGMQFFIKIFSDHWEHSKYHICKIFLD